VVPGRCGHAKGVAAVDNCFLHVPRCRSPGAGRRYHAFTVGDQYSDVQGLLLGWCRGRRSEHMQEVVVFCGPLATLSPFNAWVFLKGWETLRLRIAGTVTMAMAIPGRVA